MAEDKNKELLKSIEEREKKLQEEKKALEKQKSILSHLDMLNISTVGELKTFIDNQQPEPEVAPELPEPQDDLSKRVASLEKEKELARKREKQKKVFSVLRKEIESDKEKLPFLNKIKNDQNILKTLADELVAFNDEHGQFPDINKFFADKEKLYKTSFETRMKELGYQPAEEEDKPKEDVEKEDESTEEEAEEKKADLTKEDLFKNKKKDLDGVVFKHLTEEQVDKLSKEKQMIYLTEKEFVDAGDIEKLKEYRGVDNLLSPVVPNDYYESAENQKSDTPEPEAEPEAKPEKKKRVTLDGAKRHSKDTGKKEDDGESLDSNSKRKEELRKGLEEFGGL